MKFRFPQLIIWLLISNCYAALPEVGAIEEFKSYLQDIKSLAVDFTQIDSAGNKAAGTLLISKPYRFRCNYYPPFPIVIVGNKNYVSIYDYDMDQLSRIKSSENIFNFLLVDDNDLTKNFKFELADYSGDELKVMLYHIDTGRSSQITFDKNTRQLKKLEIFEDDNTITIKFGGVSKVTNFADDLFNIKNPEVFGPPARLGKTDIEKKYNLAN